MKAQKIINMVIKILLSGPILPGGIKNQYSVCGKKGCRCKDEHNPQRHGPYNKLSYAVAGKDSSIYIKEENLSEAKKMVERFQVLKEFINLLAIEYAGLIRESHFDSSKLSCFYEIQALQNKTINSSDGNEGSWKKKALLRQQTILSNKVRIRDLEESRENWKKKGNEKTAEISNLKNELQKMGSVFIEQKKTRKN